MDGKSSGWTISGFKYLKFTEIGAPACSAGALKISDKIYKAALQERKMQNGLTNYVSSPLVMYH